MTVWTFQQYCDATNSWGVRGDRAEGAAAGRSRQLQPSTVCQGVPSAAVTITGTSSAGSAFFDPGADLGGPGFATGSRRRCRVA